jgi:hypothetical protein
MTDFAQKIEVIELMASHEEAIAELYSAFSVKFPDCEIWGYLYGEERKHSEWLRSILNNVFDGSMDFSDMHMSERGIKISIKNLEKNKSKVEDGNIDLEEAFNIAYNLENSLIEDHYLDYFTSDNEGIMKVVNDLKSDTKAHRDLLAQKREEFIAEKIKNS